MRSPSTSRALAAIVASLTLLAVGAARADVAETLTKVRSAYEPLTAVEVPLTQTSNGPSYFEPLVQTGRFVVQRPDKLRWELNSASMQRVWMSDGTTLWVVDAQDKTVQAFSTVGGSIRRIIGFLTGLAKLEEDYTVVAAPPADAVPGRTVLKLTPKERDEQLHSVIVQIDPKTHLVRGVILVTPFGDRSDMQLGEPKAAGQLPEGTFAWTDKPGWHVVAMD